MDMMEERTNERDDPFAFQGKTLLITGASGGIGRAVAVEAARRGARVLALGRDAGRLKETLALLAGDGHRNVVLDLLDVSQIEPAIAGLCKEFGPLSGMAHCAGDTETRLLRDMDWDDAERLMRLNWLSFMGLSKAVCRRGRYVQGMSVVAVASAAAEKGFSGLSVYAASKGALIASCLSLAMEYASRGIRFNCVSPTYVDTPMLHRTRTQLGDEWYRKTFLSGTEEKRPLVSEEVARPILFLLSGASEGITRTNLPIGEGKFGMN